MSQFSLATIINAAPEIVAYLREQRNPVRRALKPGDDRRATCGPKSTPPCNIDAIDAADLILESLAYWAESAGVSTHGIGQVWRYPTGEVRGILYDDSRPVDTLAQRLKGALVSPRWVEPTGMHHHLHELMATQSTRWPTITDILWGASETTTDHRGVDGGNTVRGAMAS